MYLIFIVVWHFSVQRVKWCMKSPVTLYYVPQYYMHRGLLKKGKNSQFLKVHFCVVLQRNICCACTHISA